MQSPGAHDNPTRSNVNWGHLIVLTTVGGAVLWYLIDEMSVSMNIHNLTLVVSLLVVTLALCLAILSQCFNKDGAENTDSKKKPKRQIITVIGAGDLQIADKKRLC
jgi:magnesium-transporting ATPase (P-type)